MATPKFPGFQLYAKDWLTDDRVRLMTYEQKGYYIDCLLTAWVNDGLPVDPDEVRRLVGGTKAEFRRIWPVVSTHFVELEESSEKTGQKLEENSEKTKRKRLKNLRQTAQVAAYLKKREQAQDAANSRHHGQDGDFAPDADASNPHMREEGSSIFSLQSSGCSLQKDKSARSYSSDSGKAENPDRLGMGQFDDFFAAYPKQTGRADAARSYAAVITTPEEYPALMAGLGRWQQSDQWTRSLQEDEGRYVPSPSRFLRDRLYAETPKAYTGKSSNSAPRANDVASERERFVNQNKPQE
jgi:hypothetical protein